MMGLSRCLFQHLKHRLTYCAPPPPEGLPGNQTLYLQMSMDIVQYSLVNWEDLSAEDPLEMSAVFNQGGEWTSHYVSMPPGHVASIPQSPSLVHYWLSLLTSWACQRGRLPTSTLGQLSLGHGAAMKCCVPFPLQGWHASTVQQ